MLGFVHIPTVYYNALPDGTISADATAVTVFGVHVFSSSTTLEEWLYSFESSVSFHVFGVNFAMLALENALPLLLAHLTRKRWFEGTARLARERPQLERELRSVAERVARRRHCSDVVGER